MFNWLKAPSLSAVSWVLVAMLTVCNVLLARQNQKFRALVQEMESEQKIQIGDALGPLSASDLSGQPTVVRFDENKLGTVVLFSSTTCPFCKKQNPNWNRLIRDVDRAKYDVVELFRANETRSQVAGYLRTNGLDNEAAVKFFFVAEDFLKQKKLNTTPITLIVGRNGLVERAWFGLWNPSQLAEVNSSLSLSIQAE